MKFSLWKVLKTYRLSILLVAAVSLVGLLSTMLALNFTSQRLMDFFGRQISANAHLIMMQIDRVIYEKTVEVRILSDGLRSESVLAESNKRFDSMANRDSYILEEDRGWIEWGESGRELFEEIYGNDLSQRLISDFKHYDVSVSDVEYKSQIESIVTNKYGVNVALTQRTTDYYQADEDWWNIARDKGFFVGDLSFDESANTYVVDFAASILSDEGDFLGVVKVTWDVQILVDIINLIESEKSERGVWGGDFQMTLANREGRVIYRSGGSKEIFDLLDQKLKEHIESGSNSNGLYLHNGFQGRRSDSFVTFAHSQGFADFDGFGWVLIFGQKTSDVLGPILSMQYIIGFIFLGFVVLTILLSILYAKRFHEVDELKDEFISLAAHELKSPLTSARYSVDLLKDLKVSKKVDEYIDVLDDSLREMNALVRDLLNMSRLESGRLEVNIEKVKVVSEIKEIVERFMPLAIRKGQKIEMEMPGEDLEMCLDVSLFSLVISNLLSNAIKYSPSKKTIKIALKNNKEGVLISVTDQGIGIPPSQRDEIFSKFFRANNAVKGGHKGTGLGLFVIYNVVKGVGGDLWFKSRSGKGTTFFFQLPEDGMKKGFIDAI